jgi:type I restriction enzyme, S subunit
MLSAKNIHARKVHFDEYRLISDADFAAEDRRTQIAAGDVLLTIVGAIGRSAVVPEDVEPFTLQRSVAVLKPTAMNPRLLSYALEAPSVQQYLADNAKGTAQKGIYLKALAEVAVPVPPEREQQRIADKLDNVLGRVDAVNDRLARVAPMLKRFRQAVLAAATTGRLTADWRAANAHGDLQRALTDMAQIFATHEPSLRYLPAEKSAPFLAPNKSLRDLGVVSGGLTKNSKRADLHLVKPYLRVANVHANQLRLDDIASIGLTEAEFEKTRLQQDDLLIVEGNGSIDQIGRVALWDGSIPECAHQNHLIRWRAKQGVDPKYVLYWLLSPAGRNQIETVAKSTTGLHTLSVSKVGALNLPTPSITEQSEIVRRVDILFAYADRLEARLQAAQAATARLTPALLAKAFRGELVPQDPADEPAAELLKRLAAQTAPTAGRTRRAASRRTEPAQE